MVHNNTDLLSDIIKAARAQSGLTVEGLAEKAHITERYVYRIENENKKPSFDVLHRLVRVLAISPDLIFYPEKPSKESEIENLTRMLLSCDDRSMEIINATIKAALDSQPKE